MKKEFKTILDYLIGLILLFLILGIAIYIFDKSSESGLSGNLYVGICTFAAGVLAVIGVGYTIFSNQKMKNQELLNELDQKSEWRKELMNIAAKPVMNLEDAYRVIASLRFLPKNEKEVKESEQKEFDEISNYIYQELIKKISDFYATNNINISDTLNNEFSCYRFNILNSEEIRQYVKFLLKHHWEYNKSEKDKKDFIEIERKEFLKVKEQVDEINKDEKFENLFERGYENLSKKVTEYKTFKFSVKKIDENTAKYISDCKSNNKIIVKNLTLNKKCCKTILKGQYKGSK